MKNPFNDDDYFKTSTMSFGEHLEELRRVLINALYGLAVAMLAGFLFAPAVVRYFKLPIEDALEEFYLNKALKSEETRGDSRLSLERMNLIKNHEMVPEYQQVEISEFVENLKATYPGPFEALRFSPYMFVPDDFQADETSILWQGVETKRTLVPSAARFARRLMEEGKVETETAGQRIWELLTEEERGDVADVATKADPDVTVDEKRKLARMLNRLVDDKEFHADERLQVIKGTDETSATIAELRQVVQQANQAGEDVRRLNKLLLSSYFSRELRPPQLALVDLPVWRPVKIRVQSLNAQEAFMIWMKASFVTGLVLASPWIFYQLWHFVAAGLYPHEKGYVYVYLPVSLLLFAFGAMLAFFFVFKPVLRFLFFFNQWMEIDPDPRIGEWLGFVLLLPLAFGLSFQLPLVMLFLNRIGLVDIKTYVDHWRVALLIIAVAAMIITPGGDPYSMLLMMVPLIFLYFLGIAMCRWMPRSRNPFFDEVHEP